MRRSSKFKDVDLLVILGFCLIGFIIGFNFGVNKSMDSQIEPLKHNIEVLKNEKYVIQKQLELLVKISEGKRND